MRDQLIRIGILLSACFSGTNQIHLSELQGPRKPMENEVVKLSFDYQSEFWNQDMVLDGKTRIVAFQSHAVTTTSQLDVFQNQSLFFRQPTVIVLYLLNLDCFQNYLYQVDQLLETQKSNGWKPMIFLTISETSEVSKTEVILRNILGNISFSRIPNLDISSEVFIVFQKSECSEAYEIYIVKEQLFVKSISIKFRGFVIEPVGTSTMRRRDLEGALMNGVTQDDPTLELIATFEDVDGTTKFHRGVSVAYFKMMSDGLNFSMGAVRGTGWISQASDGTLHGMAEQLQSGEADILIAFSELLPYRLKALQFLHPYYRGAILAFFQQPPPSEIRNIFFQPLQAELWVSLLVLWVLVVISLKSIFKLKIKYVVQENNSSNFHSHPDKTVAEDAFMWGIASACGQGWHMLPQCGVMKLIMFSGLVIYIFSYTAYSAAVVTSLSVLLTPIKSWSDLANSGFKIYGDSLLISSVSITNKTSRPTSLFVPTKETTIGVTQALKWFSTNEHIAIISVADQFYQVSSKSNYSTEFICQRVSHVPVEGSPVVNGGMAIKKTSPFKKLFNYQITRIQERGLDARLSRHYSAQYKPYCLHKQHNFDTYTLGVNDVFTAFVILASAFVASTFALLCERRGFTYNWFRPRKLPTCHNVYLSLVEYIKQNWLSCHLLSFKGSTLACPSINESLKQKV